MNNQFEVQVFHPTNINVAPGIFINDGWSTVYSTDNESIDAARHQMKYIMSTEQSKAQHFHPTAVRVIRNGIVHAAFVGEI